MTTMTLCPNCRSIRKAGTICPLCNCPVPNAEELGLVRTGAAHGGTKISEMRGSRIRAISRLAGRDVFAE